MISIIQCTEVEMRKELFTTERPTVSDINSAPCFPRLMLVALFPQSIIRKAYRGDEKEGMAP